MNEDIYLSVEIVMTRSFCHRESNILTAKSKLHLNVDVDVNMMFFCVSKVHYVDKVQTK